MKYEIRMFLFLNLPFVLCLFIDLAIKIEWFLWKYRPPLHVLVFASELMTKIQDQIDHDTNNNDPSSLSPILVSISTSAEVEDKSYTGVVNNILNQVMNAREYIQKCAEHQKCMTDDILHLSRLRAHKLNINFSFYRPWDTLTTTINIFKRQADSKVIPTIYYYYYQL